MNYIRSLCTGGEGGDGRGGLTASVPFTEPIRSNASAQSHADTSGITSYVCNALGFLAAAQGFREPPSHMPLPLDHPR